MSGLALDQSSSSGRSTPTDLPHNKLFVGGLSWQTSADKLREYFGQYGTIIDVQVLKDPLTQVGNSSLSHKLKNIPKWDSREGGWMGRVIGAAKWGERDKKLDVDGGIKRQLRGSYLLKFSFFFFPFAGFMDESIDHREAEALASSPSPKQAAWIACWPSLRTRSTARRSTRNTRRPRTKAKRRLHPRRRRSSSVASVRTRRPTKSRPTSINLDELRRPLC